MSWLPTHEPRVTPETEPFWAASAAGRIELPSCDDCELVVYPPRAICPDCHSTSMRWQTLSGRGTVYSYTVTRAGGGSSWRQHLPFVVAYVRLDEGPIIMTNIVDCDPDSVEIDMVVTAVFDDTGAGSAIVRFRPADQPAK